MYKCESNKGFTLLELIISLAIIGIILLGFFRVINSTHRISTKNDRDIKALNILQSEIENLRSQIKKSPDEDGERVLFVEDDLTGRKIEIEFDEDTNEAIVPEYSKMDKSTNSIYKINHLTIKREIVIGNNQSLNKAFNDYKYIIDIKVILNDTYFSKKQTEIKNVIILGSRIHKGEIIDPNPDPDPPNYRDGVSFFRIRNTSIMFGKDISNQWETRTMHHDVTPKNNHNIKFKIKISRNSDEFYIYSTLNGIERELQANDYNTNKYDISAVKINPNSTGGKNSFIIENLKIKNYIDNQLKDSYNVQKIIGEDYVEDRDMYEYKLTELSANNEKIVEIEFDYYYNDTNATVDFLFGKKGE